MYSDYHPFRQLNMKELRPRNLTHELVPSIETGGANHGVNFWTVLTERSEWRFEEATAD